MSLLGREHFLPRNGPRIFSGGLISYGDSHLDEIFRFFKVFRLHAKQHDTAGAVYLHKDKGPEYCYMIGRGPNSCLLGHGTGLLFCLSLKLLVPSFFNLVGILFMSLLVLDIELAEKNVVKELGVYIDGQVFGYSFKPPKNYQPTHQILWYTQNLHKIDWKSGQLDYSCINTMLAELRLYRAEYFAKGVEKGNFLSTLLGKEVENLDDYGCPKIQHLNTDWLCNSYPYRHKTNLHCGERKVKAFGEWTVQHFNL